MAEYRKCKTCKHWGKLPIAIVRDVDARTCALEPFNVKNMKKDDCAVTSNMHGSIYCGSEFGCVRHESK